MRNPYSSKRPAPRMVLASTLERLSDDPRRLATILLDSTRSWDSRLDELHADGIPTCTERAIPNADEGFPTAFGDTGKSGTHERTMGNSNMNNDSNSIDDDEIIVRKGRRFRVVGTLTPRKACETFDFAWHDSWTDDPFMDVLAQSIADMTGCHIVSCLDGTVAIVLQPVD